LTEIAIGRRPPDTGEPQMDVFTKSLSIEGVPPCDCLLKDKL
jgi:hypothetical protein